MELIIPTLEGLSFRVLLREGQAVLAPSPLDSISAVLALGPRLILLSYKTLLTYGPAAPGAQPDLLLSGKAYAKVGELTFPKKLDLAVEGPSEGQLYVTDRHGDIFRVSETGFSLAGANLGMPRFMHRLQEAGRNYLLVGDHEQRVKLFDFNNLHRLQHVKFFKSQPVSFLDLRPRYYYLGKLEKGFELLLWRHGFVQGAPTAVNLPELEDALDASLTCHRDAAVVTVLGKQNLTAIRLGGEQPSRSKLGGTDGAVRVFSRVEADWLCLGLLDESDSKRVLSTKLAKID